MEVYQVKFTLFKKEFPILFDSKDTAERTISGIIGILNSKGKDVLKNGDLKYECSILPVYNKDKTLKTVGKLFDISL